MIDAKKQLGQHWLQAPEILEAIANAAELQNGEVVLEIGPGLGTLTEVLAGKGVQVIALEFDQDLIKGLRVKFHNTSQVKIIEGDIRSFNFSELPEKYKIVANIPYYLTSHLIRSISETSNPPMTAVLLIQKEVAERLCASPGQMSILAVTAQFYFQCSLDIDVPARFFSPQPKVDSQVVVLRRRPTKLFDVNEKEFFRIVKAGFSEKRKTLRNSLSAGLQISKDDAVSLMVKANLQPTKRAQELSMDDWHALYQVYNQTYGTRP
jgi:16S rRNA (adenine1518-N6/adenine1519-N6)-dimethyltransferase